MNKEIILFKLRSIIREITCMNKVDVEKQISENKYTSKFCNFSFEQEDGKKIKYTTTITIEKTLVDKLED